MKTQVAWPHTLNLTSHLIMLSHLFAAHPHFLLALFISGSFISPLLPSTGTLTLPPVPPQQGSLCLVHFPLNGRGLGKKKPK